MAEQEELNNGPLPSMEMSAMAGLACNLTQTPGEWIVHVDITNSKNGTVTLKVSLEPCPRPCRRLCLFPASSAAAPASLVVGGACG